MLELANEHLIGYHEALFDLGMKHEASIKSSRNRQVWAPVPDDAMSGVGDVHDTKDKDLLHRARRVAVRGMRATAPAAAPPTGARLSIFELRRAGHRLCDRPRQCGENVRFQKG